MEKLIKIIKEQTGDSKDLIIKEYNISNKKMYIVFIETLCDTNSIDEFALSYFSYIKIHKKVTFNLYKYIKEFIPAHNVKCVNNEKELNPERIFTKEEINDLIISKGKKTHIKVNLVK